MTRVLLRLRPAAALLPALTFGCAAGGQTGEETTLACEETRTALQADEDSPLGFGADEVLAAASAKVANLEWLETDPPHAPESGTAELSVSLDALGTAAFVKSRKHDGEEGFPCFDHVAVDVAVALATSGGALDESFDDTLRSTDASAVELSHAFTDGDVDGTLSFDADALAGRKIKSVTFDARFTAGALSGALHAGIEHVSGDTASFQDLTIACFGDPNERCQQR
jgi:hypothetical protein